MEKNRIYAAIDLKSFYASVECIERGLDPLDTHLVVADASRTENIVFPVLLLIRKNWKRIHIWL